MATDESQPHPEPSASAPATRPARAASPAPDPEPTGASFKPHGSVTYIKKEINDPDPASQSLTLSLYNCVVRFTDGAKVGQVQTALESAKVIIRNLPLHATHQEVTTLVEPFGDLVSVTMNEVGDAEIARVEFVDHTAAQSAVTVLHEHDLRGHKLAVTLDMGKGVLTKAVLRSTKVKLTWFRPSAVAYAHYESIVAAQTAARRLDGKMFNSQPIKATFQQPTHRQTTSFSVVLSGLPTRLNQAELSRFVGANATSFSIKQPPRSDFARETIVGTLLKEYGTLDAFELLPAQPGKVKVSAIAQFSRPEDASNAVASLRGRKQAELQNSPLYAELVHSIKYQLRHRQFTALRLELERISATATDVKLRWYEFDAEGKQANPVVVRASATVAANLSLVKHRLDELLRGRILCYDGDIIWHNSWLSSTEPDALRTISDSLGVDLQADSRTRTVRYFGDPTKHEECEETLYAHLLSLEAAYQRLGLRPLQMSAVMKHLPELRARFEDADISLDPVVRDLRVRGTEDKIRQIRGAIDRLLASSTRKANASGADCPVCFLPPEEDDIQELSCGHVYCRSCLGHLIKSSDDLCCPAKTGTESCNTSLPLSLIRTLVSPAEEERILTSAFLSYVNSRPGEFAYCPTPDCEMVFRTDAHTGSVLTCPNCLTQICPSCKVAFHEGLTCEEHRDQASGGFEALQKWRAANGVKACPKCGVDIEKIAGCNHMTCARCKTHMCWVCLQMFGSDGGSVYTHLREKHGGI
ncbi:hypothetical protein HMN09_00899300 [Mycena chlorophos]|uniref:RING-type domain-containing protein n=1 Tax=Mycena chlorophos TaxID=658473 RepID=A0A8H6SPP9_MYCCL|nr:hypothetical protein HMN09_00899300 [Mycena chlorophos]